MDIEVHTNGILPEIGGPYSPYMHFSAENMICTVHKWTVEGENDRRIEKIRFFSKNPKFPNGHIYNFHPSKIKNIGGKHIIIE